MAIYTLRGERIIPQGAPADYQPSLDTLSAEQVTLATQGNETWKSALRCITFPTAHIAEAARQVGRIISRMEARAQAEKRKLGFRHLPELKGTLRDEIHEQMLNRMTWMSVERAVEMSGIHQAALWEEEYTNEAWESLTRRQRRREEGRALEAVALHAGLVGGQSGNKRCSPAARERRAAQNKKNADFLEKISIIDTKTGEAFKLPSLSAKKRARLSECYAIAKGIEKTIKKAGLNWMSVVVTARPSKHPNPIKGRCTWDGTLPHKVAFDLQHDWAKLRAILQKNEVIPAGVWTREAHQDACPHVNFLIACPADEEAYKKVVEEISKAFPGKNAVKIRRGDEVEPGEKPASFATYAMKYFLKGFGEWGIDPEADGEETVATTFGFRRYGFFGIPHISCWRELRRMRSCPTESHRMAAAWYAARNGDAAAWIEYAGGLCKKRSERPIQPLHVAVYDEVLVFGGEGTPFEAENKKVFKRKEVVGVQEVVINPLLGAIPLVSIETRTRGRYQLTREATQQGNKKTKSEALVTLVSNYPREEAPPPPKTPKPPPCTEREYRLATS